MEHLPPPLRAADVDRFLTERVASAALIGIDPRRVPTTRTNLADYMSAAPIRMTPAATAVGQSQYGFPRWLRPAV